MGQFEDEIPGELQTHDVNHVGLEMKSPLNQNLSCLCSYCEYLLDAYELKNGHKYIDPPGRSPKSLFREMLVDP